jgi:D-serine deaminase-like pyridoxal phosphate-dependent protein
MNVTYLVNDASTIFTPALLFYPAMIRRNIAKAIEIAGSAHRLRPHVKTHKTREITKLELEAGITRHKCATIAEAEMLATCGVQDILLAYPLVGPNCARLARLVKEYPSCRFSVVVDNPVSARALSAALVAQRLEVDALIDVDVGQHRTGIAPGPAAIELYEALDWSPGLKPGGLHVYDGHNHQDSLADREQAVKQQLEPVLKLRQDLLDRGLKVPRIVAGGTPTFPVFAKLDLPGLELSPGTCILNDAGYSAHFKDLDFPPAALLLTRVVSRPMADRLTLDLGYKAIASDQPPEQRCRLLNIPDARILLQNEEHLVVDSPLANQFPPGAEVYAMPVHICPTCALHRFAYIIEDGKVAGQWEIAARDRVIGV